MIKRRKSLLYVFYLLCVIIFIFFMNILFYKPVITIHPWIEGNQQSKNITLKFEDFSQIYQIFSARRQNTCKEKNVVIIIPSAPNHFEIRKLIRRTWANKTELPENYAVLFIIGAQHDYDTELELYMEAQKFDDIIRYNAVDSYRNLYLKTHAMFEWFLWECKQSKYFIKADEDAILHVKRIEHFVLNEFDSVSNKLPNSMFCNVQSSHHPFRNPFSKFYVSFSSYIHFTFPDYCQGGTYMATRSTISSILNNTNLTKLIKLEDVMYTGIIGSQINLNLYASPAFCYKLTNSCNSIGIPFKAAVCGISTSEIKNEYEKLQSTKCSSGASLFNFPSIILLTVLFLINFS